MFRILFIFSIVFGLNACQNCKPTTEPNLYVSFSGSNKYSKFRTFKDTSYFQISNQILPLSINQDTSRLILKDSINQDTLIITYQRNFKYKNSNCGYEITLSNFKLIPTNSFKTGIFSLNSNSKISANYALILDK